MNARDDDDDESGERDDENTIKRWEIKMRKLREREKSVGRNAEKIWKFKKIIEPEDIF